MVVGKTVLIIMRWQVYRLARLIGKVVRFQHRGTHWWAAPFYQKQRNRSGLNNWLDCLASWQTSHFNLCILIKAKWAVSFCWLQPVLKSNCDGDLKKAFNEILGVSNVFPTTALIQVVTYHVIISPFFVPRDKKYHHSGVLDHKEAHSGAAIHYQSSITHLG